MQQQSSPEDPISFQLYKEAHSLLSQGRYTGAAIRFHRLKKIFPENNSVKEGLGRALLSLSMNHGAIRVFGEIVHHDPVEHYAHYCLGRAYENIGEKNMASRHYKLAKFMCPYNPFYALRCDLINGITEQDLS